MSTIFLLPFNNKNRLFISVLPQRFKYFQLLIPSIMITRFNRITIVRLRTPEHTINKEIQWFSESLGLFSERDRDRSRFRLFLEVLKAKKPLSSDELGYKLGLSRGTVVHHLSHLIASGIVVVHDNKYMLRGKNLETTLKKMKADFLSTFEEIEEKAKDIDKKLGI